MAAAGRVENGGPSALAAARKPIFPLVGNVRGLAAVGVILIHVSSRLGVRTDGLGGYLTLQSSDYPAVPVLVFMVVSGFVLYRPFAQARFDGRRFDDFGGYAVRRAVRIIPAYWIALTVSALLFGWWYVFRPAGLLTYYGFAQGYTVHTFVRGLAQAWTLDVDALLYLALPLAVLALRRVRARSRGQFLATELALCGGVYLASTACQGLLLHTHLGVQQLLILEVSFPASADVIACGMALGAVSVALSGTEPGPARLFVRRLPWLPWLAAVALYVLIGELPSIISPAHRMLLWLGAKQLRCLLAVLVMLPLVCGAGNGDRFRAAVGSRVPRFLNTVCFGLYLWHVPVLLVLDDLHVRGAVGWLAYSALAALFSVALATVSWYAIEQPSQTAAKRWWARRRRPVEVPAAEVEAPVPAAMQW